TPAALEDAEHVAGRHGLPGWQRVELADQPMPPRHLRRRLLWREQFRGPAIGRIRFAHYAMLEWQNPIVIGACRPEHRGRRHQAAFGCRDDWQVAGAAGIPGNTIVAGIEK